MQVEITLKNYRCFSDSRPVKIFLRKGFTGFVGVNNSGKSSLLKFFYEFRNLFKLLAGRDYWGMALASDSSIPFDMARSISDTEEVFCNLNNRGIEIQLRFVATDIEMEKDDPLLSIRVVFIIKRGSDRCYIQLFMDGELLNDKNQGFNGTKLRLQTTGKSELELSGLFQIFDTLARTLYIGPFRNAINIGATDDYFDIQVGQAFIQTWRAWKTGGIKKHNEAIYKLTDDIKHVFGFDDLEINPSDDDRTLQVFIDGKSYKLSELGSGITQFILVLANSAIKKPSFILIDEPELNLHPSLQLDFLTTLGFYASEGVLFTTHLIGLARSGADWVYTIRKGTKEGSEITELEATPRLSEFLGELNFSGYRDLGFDKILLVEGPTEIKTIQQFLRLYEKDHKIVLLPLGGDSLINGSSDLELGEIKRISENVSALIDSERPSIESPLLPNRAAFVEICKKIGIKYHVLERRAIENYFPDGAVKNAKGEKFSALQPYQKLGEIKPGWSKQENWRIARQMTLKDLDATDLGVFLSSL